MAYPKVMFIGGAPMVGKSTVARIIGSRLRYGHVSTDDLGEAITAVTDSASHPAFHYMGGRDHREYYVGCSGDELIRDIDRQHAALWPGVQRLFRNHSTWGAAAIIEGWALRPSYVAELSGDVSGVFLLADGELLERRARTSGFSKGASDEEAMLLRFVQRSLWFEGQLREQVERLGLKAVLVSLGMGAEDVADACMRLLITGDDP
jgi:2-phosphoglycerate kinase